MRTVLYCIMLSAALALEFSAETSSTSAIQGIMNSRRNLVNIGFSSVCSNLRSIFTDNCNCGNAQQVESGDSIDCDNGKLTAHAEFVDYKITSMQICDQENNDKVCTTIYYAETIAVHCVLAYNDEECSSCYICQADDGLLGLRVNCDTTYPAVTTDGCKVASTFLQLSSDAENRRNAFAALLSAVLASLWMLVRT